MTTGKGGYPALHARLAAEANNKGSLVHELANGLLIDEKHTGGTNGVVSQIQMRVQNAQTRSAIATF